MKTATKFFAFSALFSLAVGVVYWFVSYERAGSVLLAFMFLSPLMMGGYLALHGWRARLPEDDGAADHRDEAGAAIGRFHSGSLWPFVMGIGLAVTVQGFVYGRWLILFGVVVSVVAATGLMRESRG